MSARHYKSIAAGLFVSFSVTLSAAELPQEPIASGPFEPTMDSLTHYVCPEWIRDAKFGIWSHWGPQAVPMAGDWYAKHMYVQSNPRGQYQHHLSHFGHPSTSGWRDIIPSWQGREVGLPPRLMAVYKEKQETHASRRTVRKWLLATIRRQNRNTDRERVHPLA